jgi:hypothetical protein
MALKNQPISTLLSLTVIRVNYKMLQVEKVFKDSFQTEVSGVRGGDGEGMGGCEQGRLSKRYNRLYTFKS